MCVRASCANVTAQGASAAVQRRRIERTATVAKISSTNSASLMTIRGSIRWRGQANFGSYEHPLAQARKSFGLPRSLEHLSDAEAVEYARMLSLEASREESERRRTEDEALRELLNDDFAAFALDEELSSPVASTSRRPAGPDTSDSSLWPPVSPQLSASSRRSSPMAGPSRVAGAASPPPLSLSSSPRSWSVIASTPPSHTAALRRTSPRPSATRETSEEADLRLAIELSLAEARSRGENV